MTASQQFITGNLGETIPEPGHESTPTNQVKGRVGFGVAAEVATGALAEGTTVAQMATEDKATFLGNAVDVKAETLAEAGDEYSLEANVGMGKLGEFFLENHQLLLNRHFFQMCEQSQDDSLGFGGPRRRRGPMDAAWTRSQQTK